MITSQTEKGATVAIDGDQVAVVLASLGLSELASISELEGGGARSFRLDRVGDPPLVLKAFNDAVPYPTSKETFAAQLLEGLDVPHTRFLAADDSRTVLPFRFTIATYLEGQRVLLFKDEPYVADAYRQMGAMLRKLHTVVLPAYGAFGEGGIVNPKATNREAVAAAFAHGLDRFRHFGDDDALAQRIEAIVAASMEVVAHSRGAVFAHDDFQPNNVLAVRDAAGRLKLTGLIDFGNAQAADPICDLAKALFCSEHDAPGSCWPLLEGYGPIDHPDPQAAIRIYLLLHRLTMWWWLRHVGVIAPSEKHALMANIAAMVEAWD